MLSPSSVAAEAKSEPLSLTLCTRTHDLKASFCEARSAVLHQLGRLVGSMTLSTRWDEWIGVTCRSFEK